MSEQDKPSLDVLRGQLDDIDAELLNLLKRRLAVVEAVRDSKRGSGKPLFDRNREQDVFQRAEHRATQLGLAPSTARKLMAVVVDASHGVQQDPSVAAATAPARLLIVGGRGKMGCRFADVFRGRGHHVDVLDKDDPLDPTLVEAADLTMVAVPMTVAEQVCEKLGPLIRPDALLFDINSLKTGVCEVMARSCRGEALGTHPMFGPTVRSMRRQKVILCRVKPGPRCDWLQTELGKMGAELVETDPQTHDKMMAIVQVLTHFGIMVMGRALSRSGHELAETLRFMSPIYRLEIAMVGRLFSQNPWLYQEIVMSNPWGEELREVFARQTQQLADIIAERDREAFVASFEETQRYFSAFSEEALALSDEIIDTLICRP